MYIYNYMYIYIYIYINVSENIKQYTKSPVSSAPWLAGKKKWFDEFPSELKLYL